MGRNDTVQSKKYLLDKLKNMTQFFTCERAMVFLIDQLELYFLRLEYIVKNVNCFFGPEPF